MSQKITPFLWFDDQAEEAASFYTSLSRYGEEGSSEHGWTPGTVMVVVFDTERPVLHRAQRRTQQHMPL